MTGSHCNHALEGGRGEKGRKKGRRRREGGRKGEEGREGGEGRKGGREDGRKDEREGKRRERIECLPWIIIKRRGEITRDGEREVAAHH